MTKKIDTALSHRISMSLTEEFAAYLYREERAENTVEKYVRDLRAFISYLQGKPVTKEIAMAWKESLLDRYAASSINSMLASVNHFFCWMDWNECRIRPLKTQRNLFGKQEKELTRQEYIRLVNTAGRKENKRLSLVLQAICATGIRVSELPFITVEAVRMGRANVRCKGKQRIIFLPAALCTALRKYVSRQKLFTGPIFLTKHGNPLDRSNIWREMKALCKDAEVEPGKVFPHNLRHLFARTYYSMKKDLSRLADLMGHSSINTTRIYTMESGEIHARQIEKMGLIIAPL